MDYHIRTKVRPRVKKVILSQPCAVVEYYEWFKMDRAIENKKYELIIHNKRFNYLSYIELRPSELKIFRENMGDFSLVEDTKHGKVWERMDFRKQVKKYKPTK